MNHEFLFYGNMACIHTGIKRRKQVREKWSSNLFYLEKFVRMATVSNKILKIRKLRVQPLLLRAIAYSGPGKINRSNIKT
jgi:hypothetical protein